MRTNLLHFPGVFLCGAVLLAQATTPTDPREALLQATAARYDSAAWPRGVRRTGPDLTAVVLRGFDGGALERAGAGPVQRFFADAGGENRVLVEVQVGNDVDAAQRHLLGWLANVSSPGLVPTAARAGIPLGDVGFVGWSKPAERRIAWLAFVRDNAAVRVLCLDPASNPHPDLAAIAQAVDAEVGRAPTLAEKVTVPVPKIERFHAAAQCRAGERVPLQVAVEAAAGAVLRFEIEGTGQGYVEDDGRGGHVLRTTGPGRLVVRLLATGARCTTSTATLAVDVGPR
jgi:hypothetical protein